MTREQRHDRRHACPLPVAGVALQLGIVRRGEREDGIAIKGGSPEISQHADVRRPEPMARASPRQGDPMQLIKVDDGWDAYWRRLNLRGRLAFIGNG